MFYRVLVMALVALALFTGGGSSHAQNSDSLFDVAMRSVDDSTCEDGMGRTYRGATLVAALENDQAQDFLDKYESCAGVSGVNAPVGMSQYPIGLTARCSTPMSFPDDEYEWVFCTLGFAPKEGLSTPIHIELDEFFILTSDNQKVQSYSLPDLYMGQPTDISDGIDFAGPDPLFGEIVFPAYRGQVEAPFLLWWETTGDVIIVEELEPSVAEGFLRNAGLTP